ncbi:MAG: thioredoxin family protein [Anaerolineae bacterium]|nr:thioredoxin family protein [Anaerolineae bacterium]
MRQTVQDAIKQTKIPYTLEEINDIANLSKHNPISLPHLVINGQLAFSQNPPRAKEIIAYLRVPSDF